MSPQAARISRSLAAALLVLSATACATAHASPIRVADIVGANEAGTTRVRVLLPTRLEQGRTYPVVYVLPVEPEDGNEYGDGLAEVQKAGFAETYHVIFAAPTFSYMPWYADNPAEPRMRQETYFLRDVVPFVESRYPARHARGGRFLLGFSKSGWGARFVVLGYHGFRRDLQQAHAFMQAHHIAHVYRDGPLRVHRWDSGWLPGAVALLLSGAATAQ